MVFPRGVPHFLLPLRGNLQYFANLGMGQRPACGTQGQRFDQQLHHAAVPKCARVLRRVIMHVQREAETRLVEYRWHAAA
jgi:hypothetical protein